MNTAENTAENIIDISAYGYEFTSRTPSAVSVRRQSNSALRRSSRTTAKRTLSAREYYNRAYSNSEQKRMLHHRRPSSVHQPSPRRSLAGILFGMLLGILIAGLAVLLLMKFSAHSVSATEQTAQEKYYRSIQLEAGDTLWDLADSEMGAGFADKRAFISEVEAINHVDANQLHEGANLIIPYFA